MIRTVQRVERITICVRRVLGNRFLTCTYAGSFSKAIRLGDPSTDPGRAVVSYKRKYLHEVLVNLPRKCVVRRADRDDVTGTLSIKANKQYTLYVCKTEHCSSSLDLVLIAYAQKPPINAHTDQCIQRVSGLNVGLRLMYCHSLCMHAAKALARLSICAISSEPSLPNNAISTKIPSPG